jgi:hypothetical protein
MSQSSKKTVISRPSADAKMREEPSSKARDEAQTTRKTPTTARSTKPAREDLRSPTKSALKSPKKVTLSVQTTSGKVGKKIAVKGGDSSSEGYSDDEYSSENYSNDDAKGGKKSARGGGKDSTRSQFNGKDAKSKDAAKKKKGTKPEEKTLEVQLIEALTLIEKQFFAGAQRAEVRLERDRRKQGLSETQRLNKQRVDFYDHAVNRAERPKGKKQEEEEDLKDMTGKTTLPFPIEVLQRDGYGHGKVVLRCDATGKECVATFGKDGAIEVDHQVQTPPPPPPPLPPLRPPLRPPPPLLRPRL